MKNFQSGQKISKNPGREHAEINFRNHVQKSRTNRIIPMVPEYFDFLPIGYVTLDETGIIKTANQAAAEMLGVEKNLLINTVFIDFVYKEDQKNFQLDENSLCGQTHTSFDVRFKKKQDLFWARVNVSIDENLRLNDRQTVIVLCDITDLKQVEEEKTTLKHQLHQTQKMEVIGVLSTGIVHDFNNILHPIITTLELLIEDAACDRELRETLKNILAGANRAGNLVRQILSFSHQADLEVGTIKIQPIIREVLKLSRSTLPPNIKIIRVIDKACGPVMADPTHIYQIAMNLITNAFHAMGHNDGILDVTLKEIKVTRDTPEGLTLNPGVYACLSVADTGKGIDSSIMNKIFEPYFTTKEKGTGLGLCVISDIVKNYGGDIRFSSEPGKGSIFRVYIPRDSASFETTLVDNDKQMDLYGNESILYIDDDPNIVGVQKKTFERRGYNVTPFVSSLDALNEFKARPEIFDIVICDMAMPVMTGLTLASRIKQIRPDIPVIICTGFSEQINKDNYHDMGIDGFLMKPVSKKDSLKLIRHLLDNR
ncbi:MAG: response regulator [Desulfobacula sp.]|uniref:hybrid sensor histidine kinase/response regulator n=1 Tax=Desulfobacula sp. TaxID=2593537 RepID=UPI0025C42646|nr:response regulator [Desulfobacula sp.]MCD4719408.1 response regulator [Desulfobacula sp.]